MKRGAADRNGFALAYRSLSTMRRQISTVESGSRRALPSSDRPSNRSSPFQTLLAPHRRRGKECATRPLSRRDGRNRFDVPRRVFVRREKRESARFAFPPAAPGAGRVPLSVFESKNFKVHSEKKNSKETRKNHVHGDLGAV